MSSVPIPSKGDIVTIENKQYRVLKVSGTIVEVLAMYDATTSQIFNTTSKTVTFTSGDSGQQYKGSDVDTYLNETFFATLSTTMRTAIVPKNINQDMWGDSSSLIHYRPYYHLTYGSEEKYYYVGTYGTADVGSRNVYILSIGDIIDYLGVPDNGDFTDTDILQMFWGETSNRKSLWLCSAYGKDNRYIYYVDTYYNYISGLQYNSGRAVRPAFQIDWNILYPSTPALTFKHFYDAGTIGSGTVKFRHYSQQEPSTSETWVLNETLKGEPYGLYNEYATTIDFTSNGENFIKIGVDNDHSTNPWIRYYTNSTENLVYSYGKWSNTAYRTLTFATAPTGDLLTWLQANGTKQGGGGGGK